MGILGKIRECLCYSSSDNNENIQILERHLDELERLNESERKRKEIVLSTGNSIVAVISIISGVVIALSIFIQKEADVSKEWLIVFAAITVGIALPILSAIWFVFKLTSRDTKKVLGPEDLKWDGGLEYEGYLRSLITKNEQIFMFNKDQINRKVDFMIWANRSVLLTGILFVAYTILLLIWVCVK